tara:strand:- start:5381 stop:5575 length:195 start_codon:yes stop_codon:yes gene_type:complete
MKWQNILKSEVKTKEEITQSAQIKADELNKPMYIWMSENNWNMDSKEPTKLPSQGTKYFTIKPQ